jgi:polyribonucleotide nucleotidyltransferase
MDAGVPIKRPVAGIAMGLIHKDEQTTILSDILGDEDHLGDMDFKVAGTEQGVTALQLDNKIGSLPLEILQQAMEQAREGRLHILREMAKALPKPRPQLSPGAPRIQVLRIEPHGIRTLIGPGGRTIRALQEETSTRLDVGDDGLVRIFAPASAALDEAARMVRDLTGEPEVGRIYRGTVAAVKDFGVFVRLFEGIEGLVHVSELAEGRIADPSRLATPGDEMIVMVLGVDGQGKISLSRRRAQGVAEAEIENV